MIKVEKFRLTSLTIEFGSMEAEWVIKGYWITDKGHIFEQFVYSSNPSLEYVGVHHFVASEKMHELTTLIMEESHKVIEFHNKSEFDNNLVDN